MRSTLRYESVFCYLSYLLLSSSVKYLKHLHSTAFDVFCNPSNIDLSSAYSAEMEPRIEIFMRKIICIEKISRRLDTHGTSYSVLKIKFLV